MPNNQEFKFIHAGIISDRALRTKIYIYISIFLLLFILDWKSGQNVSGTVFEIISSFSSSSPAPFSLENSENYGHSITWKVAL